jgi:hypothetical protein
VAEAGFWTALHSMKLVGFQFGEVTALKYGGCRYCSLESQM